MCVLRQEFVDALQLRVFAAIEGALIIIKNCVTWTHCHKCTVPDMVLVTQELGCWI